MIQPEPEGSTQGYPLVSVEVLRYDKRSKRENIGIVPTEMELILKHTQQAGNPVNKILLKLNLSDHRSILTDSHVTLTKHGRMIKPYSSHRFIANYFNVGHLKMEPKSKDSNEVVKNETGLRDFNDSSKEGVKSKENEHVGLRDFDELCEEIVDGSSGIEKDSDCMMDLDDDGKETESKDCEYESGDAATRDSGGFTSENGVNGRRYAVQNVNLSITSGTLTFENGLCRKKKGRTHVECYMHQIEIHTPMEFLDRKMVKNGYKMAICGINKLYDGETRQKMVYGLNKWGKGGTIGKKGKKDTLSICIQEQEAQNESGNVKYKMKLDFMSFKKVCKIHVKYRSFHRIEQ
nr:hypothetical protein [Tanacetum cinerariifolium]